MWNLKGPSGAHVLCNTVADPDEHKYGHLILLERFVPHWWLRNSHHLENTITKKHKGYDHKLHHLHDLCKHEGMLRRWIHPTGDTTHKLRVVVLEVLPEDHVVLTIASGNAVSDINGVVRIPVLDSCKRAHKTGARSQACDDKHAPCGYGGKNLHLWRFKQGHGLTVRVLDQGREKSARVYSSINS